MKNSKGMSLLELLAVTLLLGIGLTGVAGMFTAGVISNRKAANITAAANRANQEIERLRDTGFSGAIMDVAHFPSTHYSLTSPTRADFQVAELSQGSGYITVDTDTEAQEIDPNTGNQIGNLKQVRVVINWGGGSPVRGSYSVTTLLANRP